MLEAVTSPDAEIVACIFKFPVVVNVPATVLFAILPVRSKFSLPDVCNLYNLYVVESWNKISF